MRTLTVNRIKTARLSKRSPYFKQDAETSYTDVRHDFEEHLKCKMTKVEELNTTATKPVLELNGKILIQNYAIIRNWAQQLRL